MYGLLLFLSLVGQNSPEDLNDFMKGVWSPYCKGISLLECPSGQAERLRDEIRSEYNEGRSLNEIRESLRAKYGDQVRMEPQSSWRGSLAYLIPWVLFVIVVILVAIFWRKKTSRAPDMPDTKNFKEDSKQKEVLDEIEARLR